MCFMAVNAEAGASTGQASIGSIADATIYLVYYIATEQLSFISETHASTGQTSISDVAG